MVFSIREKRMPKFDTSGPILVLVRRGRKGRGFSVSPIEDIANAAICADEKDLGEAIVEMLDDEEQPRVNLKDFLERGSAPADSSSRADDEEDEDDERDDTDDEDEDEDDDDEAHDPAEGTLLEGVAGADDAADQIMFNLFNAAMSKGRSMSTKKVRDRGTRKSGKKKRKRTRT